MRGAIILQSYCNHIEVGWTDNFSFSLREERKRGEARHVFTIRSFGFVWRALVGISCGDFLEISGDFLESVHRGARELLGGRA